MMIKVLDINEERCTGCRSCEMACSLQKANMFAPFKSAIWIYRDDGEGIDRPVVCRHCKNPPCVEACPVKGTEMPIARDEERGIVLLSGEKGCIGCLECLRACPFGAIRVDPQTQSLVKCDLCEGKPECIHWCATGAISFSDISTLHMKRAVSHLTAS